MHCKTLPVTHLESSARVFHRRASVLSHCRNIRRRVAGVIPQSHCRLQKTDITEASQLYFFEGRHQAKQEFDWVECKMLHVVRPLTRRQL